MTACSLLTAADLAAVIGAGAQKTEISPEECRFEGELANYEVHLKLENAAREMDDWKMLTMVKPVEPVSGIGDEAYMAANHNAIAVRKGSYAFRVGASGVSKGAPMPVKEGTLEVAKRAAAKL